MKFFETTSNKPSYQLKFTPKTFRKTHAVDFLNEQLLNLAFKNCCVMYLCQMIDKYNTYTEPTPTIYETDIT